MIDNKSILAVIPARSGSKRIPNKNILFCMAGKLFNDNSIIKGIKIYDFKIQQSSSPDTANTERAIELEEWN